MEPRWWFKFRVCDLRILSLQHTRLATWLSYCDFIYLYNNTWCEVNIAKTTSLSHPNKTDFAKNWPPTVFMARCLPRDIFRGLETAFGSNVWLLQHSYWYLTWTFQLFLTKFCPNFRKSLALNSLWIRSMKFCNWTDSEIGSNQLWQLGPS